MHPQGKPTRQLDLPIAEAEAALAERREDLRRACALEQADLHLWALMLMVFNFTEGGSRGEVVKTYAKLAERSQWGLWCEVSKVRRTVADAIDKGLLLVRDQRRGDGSQCGNAYRIDWDGIRRIIGHSPRMATAKTASLADVTGAQPPVAGAQGGVAGAQGGAHSEHLLKEYTSSCLLFKKKDDDVVVKKDFSWEEAKALAREIFDLLYPPPHGPGFRLRADDRDFLLAVSVMAMRDFDRFWLEEAARTTRAAKPRCTIRFFKGVLRNGLLGQFCDSDSQETVWGAAFNWAIRAVKSREADWLPSPNSDAHGPTEKPMASDPFSQDAKLAREEFNRQALEMFGTSSMVELARLYQRNKSTEQPA